MNHLALLLASLFITLTATAQEKPRVPSGPPNTPLKNIAKPEFPQAFSIEGDRLPAHYEGLDRKRFFEIFKAIKRVEKGEFETSADFSKRKANIGALLHPISTTDLYAFRVTTFRATYDADTKSYISDYNCMSNLLNPKNGPIFCPIDVVENSNDTYIGQNGFGATQSVHRSKAVFFNLAIKNKSPLLNKSGSRLVPVSMEKAVSLKNHRLSLLLVGQVNGAQLLDAGSSYQQATRENPKEIHFLSQAVPFNLKKFIFYDYMTGEILMEKSF